MSGRSGRRTRRRRSRRSVRIAPHKFHNIKPMKIKGLRNGGLSRAVSKMREKAAEDLRMTMFAEPRPSAFTRPRSRSRR